MLLNIHQNDLRFRDCLGLDTPDRLYHISASDINPQTGKAYAINPSSGNWDDNYFSRTYGGASPSGGNFSSGGNTDPIALASQIQQQQIAANQPAITSLGQQSTDLKSQYANLLSSIKQGQGVAENAQTKATNNELGARGLRSDTGVGAQQVASALAPVDANYQGLTAQTGMQQESDLSSIANQIASLQGGNLPMAYNAATGISAQANQVNQFNQSQQQALQLAQQEMAQQQSQYNQNLALQKITAGYIPTSYGGGIFNANTGAMTGGGNSFQLGGGNNGGGVSSPSAPIKPLSSFITSPTTQPNNAYTQNTNAINSLRLQ